MASRKEYEMLFALNAKMNGNFSGTFSKAQAEFSRLGKEIQELQRVQGNIASYQKQQAAIEATRSKLENLQKQHDLLQKEISETSSSTTALEREKAKLEQRIKDTEAALDRQGQKLETTGAKLKEAGVDTANLAQKEAELAAKVKELKVEQDKAADSAASFGQRTAQAFDAMAQSIISSQIVGALDSVKDAFLECVGIAGNFEEAMSTVEALSRANARDMAALSEEAKYLGATTKFTAKESADAMGYMAMAGWDATDMLHGMNGVLQLAAASGEDLAMVSDIVTDSLSAFGLTAADTAHFSDVLAAAATRSNTNVAIMGETFKMSASVAGALGYSIEDVAVAMGLMANSGVKGSIAGTALRNTFNGLLEGVTLTSAAFGEYEYSAIKADGTMKDFGSTIDELRGYFDQMTEAERVNNAVAVAGQRGYNGLLAILNATEEDYTSLTNSINDCTGAAQRMANVKLDNMNGQLTLMNSAWDALKTTIGEQFIPEMRGLYKIGTDVFGVMDDFVKANPGLVKGVTIFTGVMGTAVSVMTAYAAISKVIRALDMAAMFTNPVFLAVAGSGALVGSIVALTTAANDGVPSVRELTEAARDMRKTMDEATAAYQETANQAIATAEVAGIYINKLEEIEAATNGAVAGNQEYQNILALLLRTMPDLSNSISQTTDEYGRSTYTLETSTQKLRENTEELTKNAKARAYQEYLNAMYDQYGEVLLEAAENEIKLEQAKIKLSTAEKNQAETSKRMQAMLDEANKNRTTLPAEYWELAEASRGYIKEMETEQRTINRLNKAIDADADAVAAAGEAIKQTEDIVRAMTNAIEGQTEAESKATQQSQELQSVIGNTVEQVQSLEASYKETYNAALKSIQGQYALWDEAKGITATSVDSIKQAQESQAKYWRDYNANLQILKDSAGDVEGLREMLASLNPGDTKTVEFVAGLAQAVQKDKQSVKDMINIYLEAQQEQKNAGDAFAQYVEDVQGKMDGLQQELVEDIKGMNLEEDAKDSARATIQGYIDKVNSMAPAVRAAFEGIAQAARNAILPQVPNGSPTGSQSVSLTGYLNRPPLPSYPGRGYASGTESAEPGWAMVGEDGPELMFFNGGEKVLNATQTSTLQAKAQPTAFAQPALTGSYASPIQVTFQIGGNATQEVVQELWGFADEIVSRVIDTMEATAVDEARSAYR